MSLGRILPFLALLSLFLLTSAASAPLSDERVQWMALGADVGEELSRVDVHREPGQIPLANTAQRQQLRALLSAMTPAGWDPASAWRNVSHRRAVGLALQAGDCVRRRVRWHYGCDALCMAAKWGRCMAQSASGQGEEVAIRLVVAEVAMATTFTATGAATDEPRVRCNWDPFIDTATVAHAAAVCEAGPRARGARAPRPAEPHFCALCPGASGPKGPGCVDLTTPGVCDIPGVHGEKQCRFAASALARRRRIALGGASSGAGAVDWHAHEWRADTGQCVLTASTTRAQCFAGWCGQGHQFGGGGGGSEPVHCTHFCHDTLSRSAQPCRRSGGTWDAGAGACRAPASACVSARIAASSSNVHTGASWSHRYAWSKPLRWTPGVADTPATCTLDHVWPAIRRACVPGALDADAGSGVAPLNPACVLSHGASSAPAAGAEPGPGTGLCWAALGTRRADGGAVRIAHDGAVHAIGPVSASQCSALGPAWSWRGPCQRSEGTSSGLPQSVRCSDTAPASICARPSADQCSGAPNSTGATYAPWKWWRQEAGPPVWRGGAPIPIPVWMGDEPGVAAAALRRGDAWLGWASRELIADHGPRGGSGGADLARAIRNATESATRATRAAAAWWPIANGTWANAPGMGVFFGQERPPEPWPNVGFLPPPSQLPPIHVHSTNATHSLVLVPLGPPSRGGPCAPLSAGVPLSFATWGAAAEAKPVLFPVPGPPAPHGVPLWDARLRESGPVRAHCPLAHGTILHDGAQAAGVLLAVPRSEAPRLVAASSPRRSAVSLARTRAALACDALACRGEGSICVNGPTGPLCVCGPGRVGPRCGVRVCGPGPGGYAIGPGSACVCMPGFVGPNCGQCQRNGPTGDVWVCVPAPSAMLQQGNAGETTPALSMVRIGVKPALVRAWLAGARALPGVAPGMAGSVPGEGGLDCACKPATTTGVAVGVQARAHGARSHLALNDTAVAAFESCLASAGASAVAVAALSDAVANGCHESACSTMALPMILAIVAIVLTGALLIVLIYSASRRALGLDDVKRELAWGDSGAAAYSSSRPAPTRGKLRRRGPSRPQ